VSGGGGEVERGEVIAGLEARLAAIEAEFERVAGERDEYRKLYLLLREQHERLKRGLLGQKAERLGRSENPAQLTLAMLGLVVGEGAEEGKKAREPEIEVPAHQRKQPVRRPLPENLPHVTIEVLPPEVEREGRDAFEQIGCESRGVLERRPASVVIVEILKPKFIRKADREQSGRTEVLVAETPELPIERGVAGPGMLADTVVRRWQDHLPLHRLESIYAREGVEIARSTLCRWHEALAELARPVVEAMRIDARGQPYLCTDATGCAGSCGGFESHQPSTAWRSAKCLAGARRALVHHLEEGEAGDLLDVVEAGEPAVAEDATAAPDLLGDAGGITPCGTVQETRSIEPGTLIALRRRSNCRTRVSPRTGRS
jgi:transposase